MSTNPSTDDRVIAMWEMYEEGATLREIGTSFGISGQAVDSLFKARGIPTRTVAEAAGVRRARNLARMAELQDQIEAQLNAGSLVEEIAAEFALPAAELRRQRQVAEIGGRRVHRPRKSIAYTDEQLLTPVRELGSQLGTAPGVERYRKHRAEHAGLPAAGTILKRFGSWSATLRAAGFEPNQRPASTRFGARRISDEDIRRELWRVASVVGHAPSYAEYEANSRCPSAGTIRLRYRGWNAALAAHFPSVGVRMQIRGEHVGAVGDE